MKSYLQLLKDIKEKGTHKPAARANMPGTTSLFGYQFRHNLADGFPALTTKKLYWKGVTAELLWFLRGDTNIKFLDERGVKKMWHEDAYNYYVKLCKEAGESPTTFEGFCASIEVGDLTGWRGMPSGYKLGDCGYQYGKVWRKWDGLHYDWENNPKGFHPAENDQILTLIEGLKNSPEGRRHVVSAWDPAHVNDLALTWCHALFQFNCRPLTLDQRRQYFRDNIPVYSTFEYDQAIKDNKVEEFVNENSIPKYYLDCQLYQRSADVFLGVPLNIASYALLTEILCKICNMVPGEFIHTFGDVHIYDNHKEAVDLQLSREVRSLPKLKFSENFESALKTYQILLDDFIEALDFDDFILENYNPHETIKADLSTGLIK